MSKVRAVRRKGAYCDYEVVNPHAAGNRSNLARKVAKRITSKFNQHITAIMVGGTGTGKSWGAIDLAYRTALEVAKIDKGKEVLADSWREYFNLEHMAVITLDRVMEVWKNIKPHGIYILDDIGVGYSNRDWMKDKNKGMNKIIQTMRTDNTFVIYTVPNRGLIDKVPRELVEWYFEFDRSEQVFTAGLNACKFLDITSLKRENKQLFIYDVVHSSAGVEQFVRHIANKPPDALTVPYEKLRVTIARELREENAAAIGGGDRGATDAEDTDTAAVVLDISPSQLRTAAAYIKVNEILRSSAAAHAKDKEVKKKSAMEACAEAGIKKNAYRSMKNGDSGWFTEYAAAAGISLVP